MIAPQTWTCLLHHSHFPGHQHLLLHTTASRGGGHNASIMEHVRCWSSAPIMSIAPSCWPLPVAACVHYAPMVTGTHTYTSHLSIRVCPVGGTLTMMAGQMGLQMPLDTASTQVCPVGLSCGLEHTRQQLFATANYTNAWCQQPD